MVVVGAGAAAVVVLSLFDNTNTAEIWRRWGGKSRLNNNNNIDDDNYEW